MLAKETDMVLDALLGKSSRTLTRTIPLLPEPTRTEVALAWLLFRSAGVLEEAGAWSRAQRLEALERLVEVLELSPAQQVSAAMRLTGWFAQLPAPDEAELLAALPTLFAHAGELSPLSRELLCRHTARSAEGMARFVAKGEGRFAFASVAEVREHCRAVAGVLGELMTELFLHDCAALRHDTSKLRMGMVAFGEGLRVVHLLKAADAGRVVLTPSLPRAELCALARSDLDRATSYVRVLQHGQAPRGYLAFCAATLVLGFRALAVLEASPGARLPLEEIDRLVRSACATGETLDLRAVAAS